MQAIHEFLPSAYAKASKGQERFGNPAGHLLLEELARHREQTDRQISTLTDKLTVTTDKLTVTTDKLTVTTDKLMEEVQAMQRRERLGYMTGFAARLRLLRIYERDVLHHNVHHGIDRGNEAVHEGDVCTDVLLFDPPSLAALAAGAWLDITPLDVEAFESLYGLDLKTANALAGYPDVCKAISVLGTLAARRERPEPDRSDFLSAVRNATATELRLVDESDQSRLSKLWRDIMRREPRTGRPQ
ncbi:MAG: hypothetical protein M1826_003438 [Phylliscum demangeonii]|nr:MAG: hypothetical protein M1826_003438 [Phylliscum demangeonii]